MKALLLTVGSQGDVQPFVALAVRLRAGGHQAVLAAPAAFSGLASAYDVPFVPLELDVGQVGEAVAGRYGLRHLLRFCRAAGRRTAAMLPALETAAEGGADLVVHHPVLPLGQHMAELLGVPAVVGLPLPALMPTREFPSAVWPCRVPRMLNRPSYLAAGRLSGAWCRKDVDRWRRDALDLPPRRGRHDSLVSGDGAPVTVLHAFSEHILPRPADWPATAHVTGYWLLPAPEGWSPPRRLAAFLEDGGPVAYVGFGSMPNLDSARLAASIMTAAEDNDVRVVVASLDPALRRLLPSGRFLVIRSAPHDWLFPRMDAIVHHGGAGTTAAALHAGKPQAYDYSGQLELATAGEVGYSITDMAGDLTELIRAVTTGPAHLIGHCLGGFVARSAAVSEPDLVRSLTLVACGPDMRDEKHQSMLEGLARLHANGGTIALWPLVKALIAKDDTVMREFWHAKLSEMNPYWVTGTAESMADEPDRSGELVAAGIPSLVVFGKRDRRVWSHDTYAGMASRLRADHVIIPKASHSPNMEQPAILAEALLEFFAAEAALEDTPATVAG